MEQITIEQTEQRIKELRELLTYYNKEYYENDNSVISDFEFDALLRELAELEEQYPQFADKNSPTQRVGGKAAEGFAPYQHLRQMLSLGNVFDKGELMEFDRRVRAVAPQVEYVVEYKIDGLSVSLEYEQGKLIRGGHARKRHRR